MPLGDRQGGPMHGHDQPSAPLISAIGTPKAIREREYLWSKPTVQIRSRDPQRFQAALNTSLLGMGDEGRATRSKNRSARTSNLIARDNAKFRDECGEQEYGASAGSARQWGQECARTPSLNTPYVLSR